MLTKHKILLIHAPTADSEALFRGAPMSLLYAVSVLYDRLSKSTYPPFKAEDVVLFDPALTDVRDPEGALQHFGDLLREIRPALVAIGTTSYAFFWAIRMAAQVKQIHNACPVILGGPHEDEYGGEGPGASISDHGDLFDFSIEGDGEYLFDLLFSKLWNEDFNVDAVKRALLADSKSVQSCDGFGAIRFRAASKDVVTLRTAELYRPGLALGAVKRLDLNRVPFPPRSLLNEDHESLFSIFSRADGTKKRTAQMMTYRGCPYLCNFCTERGSYNGRAIESVLKEIYTLKQEGYEAIFFDDSTFHLYRYLPDLLSELRSCRADLKMEFGCLTRIDLIVSWRDRYPLESFAEAGFTYFYLGLEHYSDDALREIQKGYGTDKIDQCLDILRDTNIRLGVSLLFGFRHESPQSRKATLDIVANHPNIILANLSILAYHPASPEVRARHLDLNYDSPAPNNEPEWDLFEEGRWYHPPHVDLDYARSIHKTVIEVDETNGGRLIPKLKRRYNVIRQAGITSVRTAGALTLRN
jgi:Fe-S oxidoreductase